MPARVRGVVQAGAPVFGSVVEDTDDGGTVETTGAVGPPGPVPPAGGAAAQVTVNVTGADFADRTAAATPAAPERATRAATRAGTTL